MTRTRLVRVDEETYNSLNELMAILQIQKKRRLTLGETVKIAINFTLEEVKEQMKVS